MLYFVHVVTFNISSIKVRNGFLHTVEHINLLIIVRYTLQGQCETDRKKLYLVYDNSRWKKNPNVTIIMIYYMYMVLIGIEPKFRTKADKALSFKGYTKMCTPFEICCVYVVWYMHGLSCAVLYVVWYMPIYPSIQGYFTGAGVYDFLGEIDVP